MSTEEILLGGILLFLFIYAGINIYLSIKLHKIERDIKQAQELQKKKNETNNEE